MVSRTQLRRMVMIPAVLVWWGLDHLASGGASTVSAVDVLLLATQGILAVGFGLVRGVTTLVFDRDGVVWCRSRRVNGPRWLPPWREPLAIRLGHNRGRTLEYRDERHPLRTVA